MNEFFRQTRERLQMIWAKFAATYNSHRGLILSSITVISILLIVWARVGFTLDFSRFYAAGMDCREDSDCAEGQVCDQVVASPEGYTGYCRTPIEPDHAIPRDTEEFTPPTTTLRVSATSLTEPGSVTFSWSSYPESPDGIDYRCRGIPITNSPLVQMMLSKDFLGAGEVETFISDDTGFLLACRAEVRDYVSWLELAAWKSNTVKILIEPSTGGDTLPEEPEQPAPGEPEQPAPTPAPEQPAPASCPDIPNASLVKAAQLSVQCGTTQNALTWQNPLTLNAAVNSVVRHETSPSGAELSKFIFSEGGCWNTFGISTYTDTDVKPGYKYVYAIKTHPSVRSNDVTCQNGVQTTVTPAPITTATPTATATATPSTTPSPTASAIPGAGLALGVSGRNASIGGAESTAVQMDNSQQIEVIARVQNSLTNSALTNVVTRATLPAGFTYIAGSTTVNGVAVSVDSITTTGMSVSMLNPQQQMIVSFRASAVRSQFPVGTTQTEITVNTTANDVASQIGYLTVRVLGTTTVVQQTGAVNTGPSDAVFVAFLVSAIMTLLYVSYTHTAAYKRKEVETITQERDPLDFRS